MRSRRLFIVLGAVCVVLAFVGPQVVWVLISGIALLAPGYLLWSIAGTHIHLPRLAQAGLWVGLSLSLIPLTFLWATTAGLALSPLVLRLLLLGLSLLALWRASRQQWGRPVPLWLGGGLLLIGGATFVLRLYEIRDVVLPLWVDSVHHALLIRIIAETGQFPRTLRPYIPVDHIPYHWGYHATMATWQAITTTISLPTFMLLSGQILNALHVLIIYSVGAYLLRSPLAGLFAGLAAGLLSLMPAYYVTWGRYTQLTGLLLIPGLIMLSCLLVERPQFSWALLGCTAIAVAGMILVHYRVLIFYAGFMLAYTILFALHDRHRLPQLMIRLAGAAVGGLLLAGPWMLILLRDILLPVVRRPGMLVGEDSYNGIDHSLLWSTNNRPLFVVAGLGVVIAFAMWNWRVLVIAAWIGVLFLIANPEILHLPTIWLINNHSVVITLFLPVSLLAAYGTRQSLAWLYRYSHQRLRPLVTGATVLAMVVLTGLGMWQFRDVVNPVTNLATPADIPALAWAADNTPHDARFLINSTPWLGPVYRGTDAGWWLTPITGRWTSTPPALYSYAAPADVAAINARSATVARLRPEQQDTVDRLIRDNHITYIYIGAKGGPLKGEMFWGRPAYKSVYDHDGVLIFEVVQP